MAKAAEFTHRRGNYCEFNQSLIERIKQIQHNFKLIWFDPNTKTKDEKKLKEKELRILNEHVNVFSDLEPCITFIKSIKKEKIFLITSGAQAPEILSQVSELVQLDTVFIFCMAKERYEYLLNEYNKIVGVYNKFDELCKSVEEEFDHFNERMETFSSFDKDEESTKDLSREASTFLWYQLFYSILARTPRNQQSKEQMIQLCKEYFRRNANEMKNIEDFERTYQPENAIYWYSKKSFLYKIVNKVLRCGSIELMHAFRFFICDLSENLQKQHDKIFLSKENFLHLYRGASLNREEFKRLEKCQGKLIATNGYLSTSRKESKAREYANKSTKRHDVVRVLYNIEIDLNTIDKSIIFADIAGISDDPDEAEVLFDINACFEIKSIKEEEFFYMIHMKLSNDGQKVSKYFLQSTKKEIEGTSESIAIGKLLCDIGEYDESETYFRELLTKSNEEDHAWIEFHIGRILGAKGQWKEAEKHYSRAYEKMMKDGPKRLKDAAHVLKSMGNACYQHEKDDEALKYHRMALNIEEKCYPSNDANIAKSLNTIGKILTHQGKHNEALENYEKASTIFEKFNPSNHADLVETLSNIGVTHENQKSPQIALEYFQRALKVHDKYLPANNENLKKTKDAILRLTQTR